jgi:hypothetical protein
MRRAVLLFVLSAAIQTLAAQTYPVIHQKALWFDGKGEVQFSDDAIEYRASNEKRSRRWLYQDIQHFDRISKKEFIVLSYEDQRWKLGRDRSYRFIITDGELTDAVFDEISRRLGKPVTNRVVKKSSVEKAYELPVKHLHTFGGCEGDLVFSGNAAYYVTGHAKDAREWKLDRDVESVWAPNRYQVELHVYDNNRREFSQTRVYRFQLKEPLDPEWYHDLKLRLYGLRAGQNVIP